jgi:hypothetical protein
LATEQLLAIRAFGGMQLQLEVVFDRLSLI